MWSRTFTVLIFLTMGVSNAWALPTCLPSQPSSTWSNCVGIDNWSLPNCNSSKNFESWSGCEGIISGDGNTYNGEWRDGLPHGQGSFTIDGDLSYTGQFQNGYPNGQGTIRWTNGDTQFGEFKDGLPNGQGTFINANGNKYVGEWKNDKYHGKGIFIYANGNKQVGEFENGEPTGSHEFVDSKGDLIKTVNYTNKEKKQMWTPAVLLCLTENLTECIAIGGPLSNNEESCLESAKEVGIPYMKTKHSDKIIADYKCIKWSGDK